MFGWFEKFQKSVIDARLKRLNRGLSAVMMICCLCVLLPGLARLEIARYAFWVWLTVTAVALLAQLVTSLAVKTGIASKAAEEDKEPSALVAEAWGEAVAPRAVISTPMAAVERASDWRKVRLSGGRTIVYRIEK